MTFAARARAVARGVRPLLSGLVVLPLAVFAWGEPWTSAGGVRVDPRWLVWLPWGAFAGLVAASARGGRPASLAARLRRAWITADPWLAAAGLYAVTFRPPDGPLFPIVVVGSTAALLLLLRRAPGPVLVALAVAAVGVFVALPAVLSSILVSRIAAMHELTVDHRLKPDGREINSDGVRFRGEAADLADDDFVVLFLGDSYTFGFNLHYAQAYPYQLEAIAAGASCERPVRAVDFGWTSASPLLGLRLLREVGQAYRPDLVVYNLDMTDFHDDLRYEMQLRKRADFEIDRKELVERLLRMHVPSIERAMPLVRAVTSRLREPDTEDRRRLIAELRVPRPDERYFATKYPLEETRAAIELGVMRNLGEMHAFAGDVLGARMVLVVYPRAYQYSARESPRNWEAGKYERLGPWVREPFRYFETVAPELPYPVVDLLPRFEETGAFPLFFEADPHWTALGARVAAEGVYDALVRLGEIPCAPR